MSATELKAWMISCDAPGCHAERYGYAGDSIKDILDGTTWGSEDGLHFCYDHFNAAHVEAAKAVTRERELVK